MTKRNELTAIEIAARHNATIGMAPAPAEVPTIADQDAAVESLERLAPAFDDTGIAASLARLAARMSSPAPARSETFPADKLADLIAAREGNPAPASGQVPVMAPAPAVAVPAPVKPGKLADTDRLRWNGASHVQKGNSGRYNEWMARVGTFTVQEAVAAGIPGHHLRYVTGQGWASRV